MEVCTVSKFQQSLNFYVILTWQIFLSISVGYSVIHKVLLKILSGAEWMIPRMWWKVVFVNMEENFKSRVSFKVLFFPDLSASHSFQLYPGPRSAYSEKHLIWKKCQFLEIFKSAGSLFLQDFLRGLLNKRTECLIKLFGTNFIFRIPSLKALKTCLPGRLKKLFSS